MFGPSIAMFAMTFTNCEIKYAAVALLSVGMLLGSGVFAGAFINPIELTPQYSGILFASSNSLSAITGFGAPFMVGAMTPNVSL
ncbi:unnamed protein product [Protopolystoma xenopodis]|uniref:Major facilitator superfamily (MFS) profile domain-containing protein n=1 Tax=Protopolystoma xenopodis TaxID=117903 RepID=A0A3S5BS60_9PLAT|nr:unnamed protein product [Protopolystoma xenopodis]